MPSFLPLTPPASSGNVQTTLDALAYASKDISMGDIVGNAIRSAGTGSWSLLPTQGLFSVVSPGRALCGSLPGGAGPGGSGVNFPSWFGRHSNQGRMGRMSTELSHHLRFATHGSSSSSHTFVLDYAGVLADTFTRPLKEGKLHADLVNIALILMSRSIDQPDDNDWLRGRW